MISTNFRSTGCLASQRYVTSADIAGSLADKREDHFAGLSLAS